MSRWYRWLDIAMWYSEISKYDVFKDKMKTDSLDNICYTGYPRYVGAFDLRKCWILFLLFSYSIQFD